MISLSQDPANKIFSQDLSAKISAIWRRANDTETEKDFRKTCSWYESQSSPPNPSLKKAYQEYLSAYHQITSIYNIRNDTSRTYLCIYDSESERKSTKSLDSSKSLDHGSCIALLPNGKLFCFDRHHPHSGITFIIDKNYKAKRLQSVAPCCLSSAIYFGKNAYCFGGLFIVHVLIRFT
ncbi:unnamed protein product [Blepharisma stoltei]|uniref:Uncharacterized protein n=1 Tax=Blepharisma stoltei TaxID=1481888 RepID=A0AAU9JFZ3_9CILI|nr:unnamed protein product [Blepharisma stoltei]